MVSYDDLTDGRTGPSRIGPVERVAVTRLKMQTSPCDCGTYNRSNHDAGMNALGLGEFIEV
jgi:hypothetical protein